MVFVDIAVGVVAGFLSRMLLLHVDYRQYPSSPHAYLSHLTLGFIAAAVGAVAIPALAAKEYTAVTFLVLVATQFREVRNMERETLRHLDTLLLVPRGPDYIEGIAIVFEARNYLVMGVALASSGVATATTWWAGALVGLLGIVLTVRLREGGRVGDIADVRLAEVRFDGPALYVGDVYIMNVGLEKLREPLREWAIGVTIHPRDEASRDKLARPGQRQAIVHDVTSILGNRQDIAAPEFTPMARKDQKSGVIGVYLVPFVQDGETILRVVRNVPLLESARGSRPHRFRRSERS